MVEHAELTAVIHQAVSTSKELATLLQDEVAKSKTGDVKLSTIQTQAIASQLRITANLVAGLLEENSIMLDRLNETVNRLEKK